MDKVFEFITGLFVGSGIVIAAGAFVAGMIIKNAITAIPNKYIPLIGGVLGVVMGLLLLEMSVTGAVQGLCLGWAATGGYETIKQLRKDDTDI